jgi:hypothetical protein
VYWERLKVDFVIVSSTLEQDLLVLIPPLFNWFDNELRLATSP